MIQLHLQRTKLAENSVLSWKSVISLVWHTRNATTTITTTTSSLFGGRNDFNTSEVRRKTKRRTIFESWQACL